MSLMHLLLRILFSHFYFFQRRNKSESVGARGAERREEYENIPILQTKFTLFTKLCLFRVAKKPPLDCTASENVSN